MIKQHHEFLEDELKVAGWDIENSSHVVQNYKINFHDMSFPSYLSSEEKKLDYILKDSDGNILAIIIKLDQNSSLKKTTILSEFFVQDVKNTQGFCPFIYFINNFDIRFWDSENYPLRKVLSFHSLENLEKYRQRTEKSITLSSQYLNKKIVDRPYQIEAITKTIEHLNTKNRSALWVMATGTGKTRTAIALIDILLKQEFVSKILILVDRKELAVQMQNSLKEYLPNFARQRILTKVFNKNKVIYVSTYQTMIKLINNININQGFFDLIIVDESHRSIYKYYGQLFLKFDAIKLGLTATPINFLDRDTFDFFEIKEYKPTFQYEYDQALKDNYLCSFEVLKIQEKNNHLIFVPEKEYESQNNLSSTFRQYDELDDDQIMRAFIMRCYAYPITKNPRKSIIYVKDKNHAYRIEALLNQWLHPNFAKAILSGMKNTNLLINEFKDVNSEFHIAISVDMLTTGIDVPSIINLVFAKPIYSYVTFWQMIGRGTRLYDEEFKKDQFYIFDIYKNFEYFQANPTGIKPISQINLTRKLYNTNINLLAKMKKSPHFEVLKQEISMQIKSLPKDDLFINANMNTLAECINMNTKTIDINFQNLANISKLFDRIKPKDTQDIKFRIKIKKLQYAICTEDKEAITTCIKHIVSDITNLCQNKDIDKYDVQCEFLNIVFLKELWDESDFDIIYILMDIIAPLMKYKIKTISMRRGC